MSFQTRQEAEDLLRGFDIERFTEVEEDGKTAVGDAKHWHLFHVVARKRLDFGGRRAQGTPLQLQVWMRGDHSLFDHALALTQAHPTTIMPVLPRADR